MKRIVLTGGGTAGHVTPNMALVPKLIDEGYNIYYIGSYEGMEKKLIEDIGVTYYGISSGKLRRYFDTSFLSFVSVVYCSTSCLHSSLFINFSSNFLFFSSLLFPL